MVDSNNVSALVVITPLDESTMVNTSDVTHMQCGWAFTMVVQHSSSLSTLDSTHIQSS